MNKTRYSTRIALIKSHSVDFFLDVKTLVSGSVAAQFILLLSLPIVTRLYTPVDFGVLQGLESVVQITMIICSLGYEKAFVSAAGLDRNKLLFLSLFLACALSFIGASIAIALLPKLAHSIQSEYITNEQMMILLVFIFLGRCIFWVFSNYALSIALYTETAIAEFTRAAGLVFSRILFGVLNLSVAGLLLSSLVGSIFGLSRLFQRTRSHWNKDLRSMSMSAGISTARKYRAFPANEGTGEFCSVLTDRLPVVLLGYSFGPAAAGYYAIALLVVSRPIGILVNSASTVLRTRIGSRFSTKEPLLRSVDNTNLIIIWSSTILIVILAAIASPVFFPLIFGSEWTQAGAIVTLLAPKILALMLLRPLLGSLSAMRMLRPILLVRASMLIAVLSPLIAGPHIFGLDLNMTILAMSTSAFLCGLTALFFLYTGIKRPTVIAKSRNRYD